MFARARAERKPVLLCLAPAWCRWSREMDRTSYADPSIAAYINDRFVPVRVDPDRRPDISERYSLGGWPTTAFLTADGQILGGGTYVAHERMLEVLARVVTLYDSPAPFPEPGAIAARREPETNEPIGTDRLHASIFRSFDDDHGGFGTAPKFPHAAPVRLALDLFKETGDPRFEQIAVRTLDAMGWGALYDEVDGGFFRYAQTSAWTDPHFEKLLDPNAALLRLYLDAGSALDIARFTARAQDVLRYIQTWLADPVDAAWFASQAADDVYYAASSPEVRRAIAAPAVPGVIYADANAAMVSSAIHTGRTVDDPELTSFGIKSLERVLQLCYRPGAGVAHDFDGAPGMRGLLADQIAMAAASLDAFDVTGNIVYEMMAEELAHYAIRMLWDERDGGFFDAAEQGGADAVGLMRQRIKPFVLNCEATQADRALRSLAPRVLEQGVLGAHYALALRAVTRE
jgi:uncharacterized protein YyaL (SSP411 family)